MSFSPPDRYSKARDLGDSLAAALTEVPKAVSVAPRTSAPADVTEPVKVRPSATTAVRKAGEVRLKPAGATPLPTATSAEPAWKNRSPEPPAEETSRFKIFIGLGIIAFLALLAFGVYYLRTRPEQLDVPLQAEHTGGQAPSASPGSTDTEMPPLARTIPQPPNTNFFQNSKQNLRGDLLVNFVGFSMYYPKHWKVNGPQQRSSATSRGKFIDIARNTPDGRMQEQMLISYYPSKGTYNADSEKFAQLAKETNDTLKNILPGYQMVSHGETKINGDWRAYEVKFQGVGQVAGGEKLMVWGRRLFIPAARPGTRNGFEITMLATSFAPEVKGPDDVGVYGELAGILYTFEPSQNF